MAAMGPGTVIGGAGVGSAVQGQDAGWDGHPCEAVGGEGLWHHEERPRHLQIQGVGPRPPKREEMWLVFPEGKK